MATPPAVELTVGESQRMIPTPFLTKTYQLVDDPSSDEMISWNENGNAFVVWRPAEFSRDLLPKYFKHNNFSSFIRQLNTYGFRKIVSDRWEFSNDFFRRGEKSLLREIHRRKITQQVTTVTPLATSNEEVLIHDQTCTSRTHLFEENERLKEENSNLRCELDHLRNMCCSVVSMMSNFVARQPEIDMDESSNKVVACDLGFEFECPRLFGVSIGAKPQCEEIHWRPATR
ncbi:hypothetical protein R6Q59_031952 [Mikania micrantha]